MRKPTPSDIKASGALGPHFFTRSTMKFFDQTMADFQTEWADRDAGVVRLFAKGRFSIKNPLGGYLYPSGMTERFIDVSGDEWKQVDKPL